MSKKNKVSSVKAKGSSKSKTPSKVVSKAKVAKKAPAKKQKVEKRKPVKKVVKATKAKVIPKKKPVAKPVKKVLKASKPVKKKIVKKVVKKAIAKKVIKAPVKKVIAKKAPVKKVAKVPAKKAVVKNKKVVKPLAKVVKAPIAKKVVVEKVKAVAEPKPLKTTAKKAIKEEEKKDEVLAIINTIPKDVVSELSASKIASITSSITNPIKTHGAYAVKVDKEPNGKFEVEFPFRASPEMLYEFFSTASGLSEWFCDDVNIRNGIYTFIWDGQMQQARLLKTVDNVLARYQWVDKTDGSYFEFRIQRDDLTNDISLIVTDFTDSKSELESAKLLWQSQIEKLMHVIGSIY